jgi:hypothetical protein
VNYNETGKVLTIVVLGGSPAMGADCGHFDRFFLKVTGNRLRTRLEPNGVALVQRWEPSLCQLVDPAPPVFLSSLL